MSTSPNDKGESPNPPTDKSPVILLLGDIGDTTWRMFIPTIGLTLIGVNLDTLYSSAPWGMLAGAALGAIAAGYLIKKQLQRVNTK